MKTQEFIVEIGTEELPPKSLKSLSEAFLNGIEQGLKSAKLSFSSSKAFASPRRLAVIISGLQEKQDDIKVERRGPAVRAAYDDSGKPTRALIGFAKSAGVEIDQLEKQETDKGAWLFFKTTQAGKRTDSLVADIVNESLQKLPIPKRMRWGSSREEFVRPVQWVLMLLDDQLIDTSILGVKSGNTTKGHRFHCKEALTIASADVYESTLEHQGKVIPDFNKRKELIRAGVLETARSIQAHAVIDEALLEEVTALNEWPVPLLGNFDQEFLQVPSEALISSMKEHQKYFHLVDDDAKMLPNFITISNIESKSPEAVVQGNEKVIRPRLSDAAFFFNTDKKQSLEQRRESLRKIVFQEKLGTIYDKTERVASLAKKIAEAIGADPAKTERAAILSKSDLVSEMVMEFTDLQGIMGTYYALNDGEDGDVAKAINDQYKPKGANDSLPETLTGSILAVAEKMDSLVGLFGINQPPSGTKDPFALRRAAIGILRILVDQKIDLDLKDCIRWSIQSYPDSVLVNDDLENNLLDYLLDRFRAWYNDKGIKAEIFLAVHARRPSRPVDFDNRIHAVASFYKLESANALAAANKRVGNILNKAGAESVSRNPDSSLFSEAAESELNQQIMELDQKVMQLVQTGEYTQALEALTALKGPVDQFFEQVMVNVDDEAIRQNRLALLNKLRNLFIQIADISLLSA